MISIKDELPSILRSINGTTTLEDYLEAERNQVSVILSVQIPENLFYCLRLKQNFLNYAPQVQKLTKMSKELLLSISPPPTPEPTPEPTLDPVFEIPVDPMEGDISQART